MWGGMGISLGDGVAISIDYGDGVIAWLSELLSRYSKFVLR